MGKNRNLYISKGNYTELQILDKDLKIKAKVIIDNEEVEKLKKYCFRMHNKGYITTAINGKTRYLHQIIYGKTKIGHEIDHINRNKLDNRKANLRECEHIQNTHNRIKENKFNQQGVTKIKRLITKPYQVRIAGKHIGYYRTVEEAVNARKKAEKEMYKEFATI